MTSDDALIEAIARGMAEMAELAIGSLPHGKLYPTLATAALAAIRKTHAVVPREQAHDARAWEMVAQTMEKSRDDVRSAARELLDAYSAYFPPGNPWGDKVRQALGIGAEGHDPTNPFVPRERPKKLIRLMTDTERRAAGLDPNGGFDGPTGAD